MNDKTVFSLHDMSVVVVIPAKLTGDKQGIIFKVTSVVADYRGSGAIRCYIETPNNVDRQAMLLALGERLKNTSVQELIVRTLYEKASQVNVTLFSNAEVTWDKGFLWIENL